MCGIFAFFNRESIPDQNVIDTLFKHAEKRGQDATGWCIVKRNNPITDGPYFISKKIPYGYSELSKDLIPSVYDTKIGDIVLGITRARPETEGKTTDDFSMQPCFDIENKIVLIHNGAVSNKTYQTYNDGKYSTNIDSEAIIKAYLKHGKNMKETCENIIAGFAFILYDGVKDRLYVCSNHVPIAHGYIRGLGFMVHSSNDALQDVVMKMKEVNRCGVNVWEDYYFHDLRPFTIYEYDMDSGFETSYSFEPRYFHPTFDNILKRNIKEKVLVCASGGIDSGLTGVVLKKLGYDVEFVHFDLNQNAEEEERWAIEQLGASHDIPVKFFDIGSFYKEINDPSMLNKSKAIPVTTGSIQNMKNTAAWQSFRNGIFVSLLTAYAESLIFQYDYKTVYIAHGFGNLSEEGSYPDNSGTFFKACKGFIKTGSLCGHRIKMLNVMNNVMKSDEWFIGSKLGFKFEFTCSCDNPKFFTENYTRILKLCSECGSTKLSRWAAKLAGVEDPRKFYESGSYPVGYEHYSPKDLTPEVKVINEIIERLNLPKNEDKEILVKLLNL